MKKSICIFIAIVVVFTSCKTEVKKANHLVLKTISNTNHPSSVDAIELAHKKTAFQKHESIVFNLKFNFDKNTSTTCRIITSTNSSAIRLERPDGSYSIAKHGVIYTNTDSSTWEKEKFDIYTWQYFFMLAYKLSDKGTIWKDMQPTTQLNDTTYNLAKLTFGENIGDTPDDWYLIYTNPTTNLIEYAGYIVTAKKSKEEAEKDAHLIKYLNYEPLDNIPVSRLWEFYDYEDDFSLGKKLGEVKVTSASFIDTLEETYDISNLEKITL